MQRLVQGDVGSGKTIVAALAVIEAVSAGYQAVVMSPTELLAEQHFKTFSHWLAPLGIELGWCVGKQKASERKKVLENLADGTIRVAIGTHALFQEAVKFENIGLVVIDEQHRFGVHQRMALRDKGKKSGLFPHQLVMTATPIPRTLAMTAYADLNVSVIDELPPGRTAVKTVVIPDSRRSEIIERVHLACQENRQVYWVCTLVEESEHLQCQAAEEAATDLQTALPDLRIALIHGRMKSAEKEQVMNQFKLGNVDLLVATTVIEVGVDVPNASLMVIENSERLGLAQLHQLRGRVGRGEIESHCVLMYQSPLSENGQSRLTCLRETNDGFVIAQRDLELRGPGELLGTKQTGLPEFRVANLMEDQDLIEVMAEAADQLLAVAPENSDALVARWFGHKVDFGHV
jgi:ATP-dependent DNA helicase RecG